MGKAATRAGAAPAVRAGYATRAGAAPAVRAGYATTAGAAPAVRAYPRALAKRPPPRAQALPHPLPPSAPVQGGTALTRGWLGRAFSAPLRSHGCSLRSRKLPPFAASPPLALLAALPGSRLRGHRERSRPCAVRPPFRQGPREGTPAQLTPCPPWSLRHPAQLPPCPPWPLRHPAQLPPCPPWSRLSPSKTRACHWRVPVKYNGVKFANIY